MFDINKVVVIIPSLEPDNKFMEICSSIKEHFEHLIVINDGSKPDKKYIFNELEKNGVVILNHAVNLGKGRALKTAFNHLLCNYTDSVGVITADSDGQHTINDIIKCAKEILKHENSLILGTRNFNYPNIPGRSRIGNKITSRIFKYLLGINISDTQTGLRGIRMEHLPFLMRIKGERFEYETNMLIDLRENKINYVEVPIETIYIESNESSHFNPVRDSLNIYKLFVKYIFSSLSSFVLDISIFALLNNYYSIIFSTIGSRILSSLYNFTVNRSAVFKHSNKSSFIKYYILIFIQLFISALTVEILSKLLNNIPTLAIKITVDTIIFFVNFYIQREWIFKD